MALRDGIAEWARTFFQEEDRVFKSPFLKRRTRSTATQFDGAVKLIQDYWAVVLAYLFVVYFTGTRLLQVRLLALLGVCKRPWSPRGRGEMAMAVP